MSIKELIETAKLQDVSWYRKVIVPKLTQNKKRYQAIEDKTGIPKAFVACLHVRENASDLGVFKRYLGNGQLLSQKTTIVPKGRGPFKTWEEGAIDALVNIQGLNKIKDWTLETAIIEWEKYNGLGYKTRGKNSPYVWNMTNHGVGSGHFTSDGKYSATAQDGSIGCFAMYQILVEADIDFAIGVKQLEPVNTNFFTALFEAIKQFFSFFNNTPSAPAIVTPEGLNPMDTLKEKIRQIAEAELGTKEIVGSKHSPRIIEYHSTTGKFSDDETAWCSSFCKWVCLKAGVKPDLLKMITAAARSWLTFGVETTRPKEWDIVIFWRGSISGWQGHVAFFKYVKDGRVYCVGGNQSDAVNLSSYPLSQVLGYRTYKI